MNEIRIIRKKTFESITAFEHRINKICKNENYRAVSIAGNQNFRLYVLLEKVKEY